MEGFFFPKGKVLSTCCALQKAACSTGYSTHWLAGCQPRILGILPSFPFMLSPFELTL